MPAPPVFAHRAGQIRVVEVFRQFQPEKAADADGHIAVTGEVEVELHHVSQIPQHQRRGRHRGCRHRSDPAVDQRQLIGDDRFFGQTQHKPLDAITETVQTDLTFGRFSVEAGELLVIPHNGAGGAVAEEGEEHKKTEGTAGSGDLAAGHIRQISDGRKNVKADAQRQGRGEHRQQIRHQRIDAAGREACVLERRQHRQVSCY